MKRRNFNNLMQDRGEINLQTRSPKSTHIKMKKRNGKLAKRVLKEQLEY